MKLYTKYTFKFTPNTEFLGELIVEDYILIPQDSQIENTEERAYKLILKNYDLNINQIQMIRKQVDYEPTREQDS
jgi:hypothetical protein